MSIITISHSEKSQVRLKTKQNPAFFLFTEGIPETLGQRKHETERKGKIYQVNTKQNKIGINILINQTLSCKILLEVSTVYDECLVNQQDITVFKIFICTQ